MKKKEARISKEEISFDKALSQLESLVDEMERGELTLEAAMQKHAEGTELAHFCLQQLQASEKVVNKILRESDGVLSEIDLKLPEEE